MPSQSMLARPGLRMAGVAAALSFGSIVNAGVISVAVIEGDEIPDIGAVTTINNLDINATGDWIVEVSTDHADPLQNQLLLRNGLLYWREHALLPAPPDALIEGFDSVLINDQGHSVFNFFLAGPYGPGEDSSVCGDYFGPGSDPFDNLILAVQEGAEAPGLSPGTMFIGFFDVKNNNVDHCLLVSSVDDPLIPSSVDRALYILDPDEIGGGVAAYTLIAAEGDVLPGQTEAIQDFGTGPHNSAINDEDDVLFFADQAGDIASDGAIFLWDSDLNTYTVLAQENGESPIVGRPYDLVSSRAMDLNNVGQWAIKARIQGDDADDELIVVDGASFKREGDPVPGLPGFQLFGFGSTSNPVCLSDTGSLLWYGVWDHPQHGSGAGLFYDETMIVRTGVTEIDGSVVAAIVDGNDAFRMSDDGRFIIFEAILADGRNGAFIIDGLPCPWDLAVPGDGTVGLGDLNALLSNWGMCPDAPAPCPWDLASPQDGNVGLGDLNALLSNWGPCP